MGNTGTNLRFPESLIVSAHSSRPRTAPVTG